jgi:hypothetical protein
MSSETVSIFKYFILIIIGLKILIYLIQLLIKKIRINRQSKILPSKIIKLQTSYEYCKETGNIIIIYPDNLKYIGFIL